MEDKLVGFELAFLAKSIGFDWKCNYYKSNKTQKPILKIGITNSKIEKRNKDYSYHFKGKLQNDITLPTQNLLQKWLRETYNIHVEVNAYYNPAKIEDKLFYELGISTKENSFEGFMENISYRFKSNDSHYRLFDTHEEALEIGLKEGLMLIKI